MRQQATAEESGVERNGHESKYENYTGWLLCADENRSEQLSKTTTRLKNIKFCQSLLDSHKEIDRMRSDELNPEDLYCSTKYCELLFNEASRLRVLDIPGFHSEKHFEGAINTAESNLSIVRNIVHIQVVAGVRFRRVLYFVMCPVERSDRVMQGEISQMVQYFGKSIFRRMVIIAIIASHISEDNDINREKKFPPKVLEKTKQKFQEALKREFDEKGLDSSGLPEPPIIAVAMTDTCEDILNAVTSAWIQEDSSLQLEFNPNSCIRCSMTIGTLKNDLKKPMACSANKSWSQPIPYSESTCHPRMVPKYSAVVLFSGAV